MEDFQSIYNNLVNESIKQYGKEDHVVAKIGQLGEVHQRCIEILLGGA